MILTNILSDNAQRFGDLKALTMKMGFRTLTMTYKQVYEEARKVALFLEKNEINKGDKVLICAPNSPYWVTVFWGCLLRGAIAVPLNIQSTDAIIEKIIQHAQARIIFHHAFFKSTLPEGVSAFRIETLPELVASFNIEDFVPNVIDQDDIAEIMYTSGTTGDPKGVVLTHKNIYTNLISLTKVIPLTFGEDCLLSILPLSHIFEQTIGFFLPYSFAAHIVYAHSHSAIRSLLKEHKATKLIAVPEFLHLVLSRLEAQFERKRLKGLFDFLIRCAEKINSRLFSRILFFWLHKSFGGKLTTIASGGAPLDADVEKRWEALGFYILQGYGLTETAPVVTCNTYKEHKIGSVGKVLQGVEVKLADDGEVLIKGDNVFSGYYKNEQKTKECFTQDGWFKTGDIGEFDEQGYLFLRGRKKYMILGSGGQNVFPEDVEAELNKIDGVKDSCVLGLKKSRNVVHIHAVLLPSLKNGEKSDGEAIVAQANEKLASYQRINSWSLWKDEEFPRTATKKIKKDEVIKVVQQVHKPVKGSQQSPLQVSQLTRILSAVSRVDIEEIEPTTFILQELNVDSLMRVELVARIEEDCGVLIDESKITQSTTVADLEEMIRTYVPPKVKRTLKRWPRTTFACIMRFIAQSVLFTFMRLFIRLKVKGLENLKETPLPVIFMPNHSSYADPLVVTMAMPINIRARISFAAAQDALYEDHKMLVFPAELLMNTFSFPRREHENIKVGLDRMGQLLDKGFSVVIFPEGKLSETGEVIEFKKGAGLVAAEMDSYIVPVKIDGINAIFPYDSYVPRGRGTVTVTFGTPVKFKRSDSYSKIAAELEEMVKKL